MCYILEKHEYSLKTKTFSIYKFGILLILIDKSTTSYLLPPTTQNKIIPLEIRSPLSLAISCSAWVHKCMGAQKRERECTGLHWRALTLFFARTTLFCVMDGTKSESSYFCLLFPSDSAADASSFSLGG